MDEPLDPIKPLAAAQARFDAAKREKKRRATRPDPNLVLGMVSAGIPRLKVADVLEVSPNAITRTLQEIPDSEEIITKYRRALKTLKIQKAHAVEGRLWARIEKEIPTGNAKDVDALFRAAAASEKIQASVAGEGQKVEVTGAEPQVNLAVLIKQVLGEE